MPWSDAFWRPIKLKDRRLLATLSDARELISALSPQSHDAAHWQEAEELLWRAAISNSSRDAALAAMVRALMIEGLI
jgi:hypothetical protein